MRVKFIVANKLAWSRLRLRHTSFSLSPLVGFKRRYAEFKLKQFGFIHGGVLSCLADNAMTFAGGIGLGTMAVITSEMKINYIRPATGETLIARASAVSSGCVQSVVRCEVYAVQDGVEKLCAAAQGTILARDNAPRS